MPRGKRAKGGGVTRKARRVAFVAQIEGLENTPSAWIEQKATGITYGVKSYKPDIHEAAEEVKTVYLLLETFVRERRLAKGPLGS
jgi:hypothetical protein